MERHSHPRLDSCLLFFTAFWLCLEPGATARDETRTICFAVNRSGTYPKSCGTCGLGKCCENKQCRQCRSLPKCREGEELSASGTIDFRYLCRPCPNGTFSATKNGCCIPWEDCKSQGLQILQAGNRTHNAQCGLVPTTAVMQPASAVTAVFTILTAAGVFVLLLMTFLLIVCTWTQKKEKFPLVEESESPEPLTPVGSHLLLEDAYSCQFPEEEQGGEMVE